MPDGRAASGNPQRGRFDISWPVFIVVVAVWSR
jgi:hypothetical protein